MPRKTKVHAPPQLPTTLPAVPPRRKLLYEVQTLNRFDAGLATPFFEWAEGLNVWLDSPEDPDLDSFVDVLSVSPKIELAISGLTEWNQELLKKRMSKCESNHTVWKCKRNDATWRSFVKSVGALAAAVVAIGDSLSPTELKPAIVPDFSGRNSKWKHFLKWAWEQNIRYESADKIWLDGFRDYETSVAHIRVGREPEHRIPKMADLKSVKECLRQLLSKQGLRKVPRKVTESEN